MNTKTSLNINQTPISTEEAPIITLLPCDYDSSEENEYANSSQDSIDSSELVENSDDETQHITEIYIINKKFDKIEEKNVDKNDEFIFV